MILQLDSINTLTPLSELLRSLSHDQYNKPLKILSSSSIGAHVRHILEFYTCLIIGIKAGTINYDERERNFSLENDKDVAISLIKEINLKLTLYTSDRELFLKIFPSNSDESILVATNFYRELAYNIEHSIHHLAIIKIGVLNYFPEIVLLEGFGIANSTLKFKKKTNREVSIY